ncbi:MAG: hypothetical protein JXA42_19225 [Anaerolineales bacterium]|nr:hypothetical protein [Anaerolineales bacterium]
MKNETAILESLVKLMATLNVPDALDRGTLILLYQNSREMGLREGEKLDRADTLATALDIIKKSSWGKVWNIELWRDQGQEADTFVKDGKQCAWLIWRECPVREVCRSEGVDQDGVLCHISYKLFSGILSAVLNEKIDITPVAVGPNACKKIAVWR